MAKRSQLAVGQEWAYQRGRTHEYKAWGTHNKVTILAVEPYQQDYRENYKTKKGLGVLVSVEERYQGEIRKTQQVVQLSQLWKPWAEYEIGLAEYKAHYEIIQAKAKIAKAKEEKFQEEIYQPALKEFLKTIKPFAQEECISGWTRLEELPIEILQAVTKALKEKAVA